MMKYRSCRNDRARQVANLILEDFLLNVSLQLDAQVEDVRKKMQTKRMELDQIQRDTSRIK